MQYQSETSDVRLVISLIELGIVFDSYIDACAGTFPRSIMTAMSCLGGLALGGPMAAIATGASVGLISLSLGEESIKSASKGALWGGISYGIIELVAPVKALALGFEAITAGCIGATVGLINYLSPKAEPKQEEVHVYHHDYLTQAPSAPYSAQAHYQPQPPLHGYNYPSYPAYKAEAPAPEVSVTYNIEHATIASGHA